MLALSGRECKPEPLARSAPAARSPPDVAPRAATEAGNGLPRREPSAGSSILDDMEAGGRDRG